MTTGHPLGQPIEVVENAVALRFTPSGRELAWASINHHWGLLDLTRRTFAVRRVPYDIDAVATAIKRSGLPTELADRLYTGV